jgi:phosphoglycerol transferase MdoB-like AlkP superfamily enzyme
MKRFLGGVGFLITTHALALFVHFLFRAVLFVNEYGQLSEEAAGSMALQIEAFLRGVWFDNVVACYVLLLPLLAMSLCALFDRYKRKVLVAISVFMVTLHIITFMASAANIPYFGYFSRVINSSIFNWFEYKTTTAGMLFGEWSFFLYFLLFFAATIPFAFGVRAIRKRFMRRIEAVKDARGSLRKRLICLGVGICCMGLCILGIRGRTGRQPIKTSAAYFCEDPTLNQLGISPSFNLLMTVIDDHRKENLSLALMDKEAAVKHVQRYLGIEGQSGSPLERAVKRATGDAEATTAKPYNVVLVFMESMSASFMKYGGQKKELTPYLNNLFEHSVSFSNCYSSGIHTNQGVYSTLYSFPSVMRRNAMKGAAVPLYAGLPTVLKEHGYRNLFLMTHESQFDNMNAFLRTNGFDEVYSQEDYPKEMVVNSFGIPDDYLYEYALGVLRQRTAQPEGEPFFAALLSISNHPPYVIPASFHPKSKDIEEQIVEYADWAIANFMEAAAKEPWYDRTIFIFVGDHGKKVGDVESELPISYNHIPLIFLGKNLQPEMKKGFAGQVDIAPTVLGMLNINYTQVDFGVDLMKRSREEIFYSVGNVVAA